MQVSSLPRHKLLTRALYRLLIRELAKLKHLVPIINTSNSDAPLRRELNKASLNPQAYGEFLRSELEYSVRQKFRTKLSKVDSSLYLSLVHGKDLIQKLRDVSSNATSATSWLALIDSLVTIRAQELQRCKQRTEYLANRAEIDSARLKYANPLLVKRAENAMLKSRKSREHKTEGIVKSTKKAMAESADHAAYLTRHYVKVLQKQGKLPNPYKLPYMSSQILKQGSLLPDSEKLIPGSTRLSVMEAAYDMRHIESITMPEVEHLLNELHMTALIERINESGPYKVKIRHTEAGPMSAHFLRLPYGQGEKLKRLAIDIKRLMRAIRKQFIWNLDGKSAVSEPRYGDGYAVRGSGGYSVNEIMYPRQYYERLCLDEAEWECRISVINNPAISAEDVYSVAADSWLEPLQVASAAIDEEVHSYHRKYRLTPESEIFKEQAIQQQRQDEYFRHQVHEFQSLLLELSDDNVFLHSDLYNSRRVEDNVVLKFTKSKLAIPCRDRVGLGMRLGDYMAKHGFRRFEIGHPVSVPFQNLGMMKQRESASGSESDDGNPQSKQDKKN